MLDPKTIYKDVSQYIKNMSRGEYIKRLEEANCKYEYIITASYNLKEEMMFIVDNCSYDYSVNKEVQAIEVLAA